MKPGVADQDLLPEDASYIIGLLPGSSTLSSHDPSAEEDDDEQTDKKAEGAVTKAGPSLRRRQPTASLLRGCILENIAYPVMALSADGKTTIFNREADKILRDFANVGREDPAKANDEKQVEGEADVSWLLDQFTACDPDTWVPLQQAEYPIYRAAVLGQTFKRVTVGMLVKKGDERKLMEIDGFPMFNQSGKFVGGMVVMRDATSRLNLNNNHNIPLSSVPSMEGQVDSPDEHASELVGSLTASHGAAPRRPSASYSANDIHLYQDWLNMTEHMTFTTDATGEIEWVSKAWCKHVSSLQRYEGNDIVLA